MHSVLNSIKICLKLSEWISCPLLSRMRFSGEIRRLDTYEHMSLKVMRHFWLDSNLCHQRQYKAEISEFLPTQQWCSQTIEHAWFCVFRVWALWWQHCEILGRWSCDIVTLLLLLSSAHCVCIRSGQGTFGDKMELLKNSTWVFKGQFVIPFFSHKKGVAFRKRTFHPKSVKTQKWVVSIFSQLDGYFRNVFKYILSWENECTTFLLPRIHVCILKRNTWGLCQLDDSLLAS